MRSGAGLFGWENMWSITRYHSSKHTTTNLCHFPIALCPHLLTNRKWGHEGKENGWMKRGKKRRGKKEKKARQRNKPLQYSSIQNLITSLKSSASKVSYGSALWSFRKSCVHKILQALVRSYVRLFDLGIRLAHRILHLGGLSQANSIKLCENYLH